MSKRRKSEKKQHASIMHRDIKDLEITRSLKHLANIRVTDWELKDLPSLRVTDWELKDIANYRVTEWELKDLLGKRDKRNRDNQTPSPQKTQKLADAVEDFVRFVSKNLIDHTGHAIIHTNSDKPGVVHIRLELEKRDAASLIGHGGHTAAAIRHIIKDVGQNSGIRVTLQILERKQ